MKTKIEIIVSQVVVISILSMNAYSQESKLNSLLLGDAVPSFEARTSQGTIKFPGDFYGKWKIILSHPADFTPVCATEMLSFALAYDEFKALNCELIGLSVDSYSSHLQWIQSLESITYKGQSGIKIRFPIISDQNMVIAQQLGMIHPNAVSTRTIRAVIIVDTEDRVSALLYYPEKTGRNVDEIKRLLIALQVSDRYAVETPSEWQPGDDVILGSPQSEKELKKHEKSEEKGNINCLDWYLCYRKL